MVTVAIVGNLFQSTLDRIQNQMKTAVDGSNKLQSENERIGGKLNEIVEKYQEREAVSGHYVTLLHYITLRCK